MAPNAVLRRHAETRTRRAAPSLVAVDMFQKYPVLRALFVATTAKNAALQRHAETRMDVATPSPAEPTLLQNLPMSPALSVPTMVQNAAFPRPAEIKLEATEVSLHVEATLLQNLSTLLAVRVRMTDLNVANPKRRVVIRQAKVVQLYIVVAPLFANPSVRPVGNVKVTDLNAAVQQRVEKREVAMPSLAAVGMSPKQKILYV